MSCLPTDSLDHIRMWMRSHRSTLYMDQVTTFMEKHLSELKRCPEDKVLTKTMINNYAKQPASASPVRKIYLGIYPLLLHLSIILKIC